MGVQCSLNSILVAWESLNAGLAIESAAKGCKDDDEHKGCVADISTVVTATLAVTNFLLSISQACTSLVNPDVLCAADVTGIASIISDLTGSSTSISATCAADAMAEDALDIIVTPLA